MEWEIKKGLLKRDNGAYIIEELHLSMSVHSNKNVDGACVYLFDCSRAGSYSFAAAPVKCGSNPDCGLNISGSGELFEVTEEKGLFWIEARDVESLYINGARAEGKVAFDDVCTIQFDGRLFYLIVDGPLAERAKNMDVSKWLVFHVCDGRIEDEVPFGRLRDSVLRRGLDGTGLGICPSNFEIGFQFSRVFGFQGQDGSDTAEPVPVLAASSEFAVTCPMCWIKFDVGDAMSIASHESLRGDPILGPDQMLRFLPTTFNDDGVALDAAGMPSPDIACPHCRRKLPPNYLNLDQKIMSIVGAPSSGKSYYLSVLIRQLQDSLFRNFAIVMKDLDPSGNVLLTQMKNRLFSAVSPEDAILAKTALEGAMYERYPRFGKMVALPKPMTYSLSKNGAATTSMIFYDNAGEHFEPGLDIEESPGAMHVASSSAIFFLFDPASNYGFKSLLKGYPDPQLSISGRVDQQDTILAEMEVRIKRILAIDASERVDTPLAIILGKSDMWRHLLDRELKETLREGALDLDAVDSNSQVLRDLMLRIAPAIVAQADTISTNVKYFELSALGHSPQMLFDGRCAGMIAPVPSKLEPHNVEIPTIWALSQTTDIIPTVRSK